MCEDNRYSATTATEAMTGGDGAAARAQAIGIPAIRCDGNDVIAIDAAVHELVAAVRAGGGPRLLHAVTYRLKGHVSVDPASYRSADEVARAAEHDAIALARSRLLTAGVAATKLDAIVQAAHDEVAAATRAAESAPWPEAALAYTDIQDIGQGRWH